MKIPYVINLQKYSIHDGDGIRTTVFLKGCLLSCWWCHNPESQSYEQDLMVDEEKCTGCGSCVDICTNSSISLFKGRAKTNMKSCTLCFDCVDGCIYNNRHFVGKQFKIEELVKELEKDKQFYEDSQGGITLSGGEVMTQPMDYIEELIKKLKRKGYNVAIDTCGYAPTENFKRLLKYVDTFLYDVKVMNDEKHKKYMGKYNELILHNLKFISDNNGKINIRIPIIYPVNSDEESIDEIIDYLKKNIKVEKVNLLPYHNTGSSKYVKLQKEYRGKDFEAPTKERMEEIADKFRSNGFINIKIGG